MFRFVVPFEIIVFLILFSLFSCSKKGEIDVKINSNGFSISKIQINGDKVVIDGKNLKNVTKLSIRDEENSLNLKIDSIDDGTLVARFLENKTFKVGRLVDFILSSAHASTTYQVNFSLCDSKLGGKSIDCNLVPNDKDVLSYDATDQLWKPRAVNGLQYLGTWDATTGAPTLKPSGSYYVISVSGTIDTVDFGVGDWIVSNGSAYQKIDNSTLINSVHGRTGAVVAENGDYNITQLGDVDLTIAPVNGKVLKYNGSKWVAGDDLSGGGAGTISSTEILDGTISTVDLANNSVNDSKISDVAASKVTGTLNGTQIGSGVIVNSHIDVAAGIEYSKLNIPTSSIPYEKLNIAAGEIPQDRINGLAGTINSLVEDTIVNGVTAKAPSQNAVYDSLLLKANLSDVTQTITTNIVTGLTAPVAQSDATNKQYVDTEISSVNTNLASKVNKSGDTITGDLNIETNLKLKGGSNFVSLKADSSTSSYALTFPTTAGSTGNVLTTNGAGVLSWSSLSTVSPVTSVAGKTGAVTLTSSDVGEGSNLYHTDARVLGTAITAPTLTNSSIATSDTIQIALGKLQAQFNNVLSVALSGLSTATNAAISAADTIVEAFGKLQKQITDLTSTVTTLSASEANKLNKNTADSITATITVSGAGDILVPSTPAGMTSVVNKTYVDDLVATATNQWTSDGSGNIYRLNGNVSIGTSTSSGPFSVAGGTASSGAGLPISLIGQNGAAGGDNLGGNIILTAGNSVATSANRIGGSVIITGGTGAYFNNALSSRGGPVTITAGTGATSGNGGYATLQGGNAGATAGAGGHAYVKGGSGTSGAGGFVSLSGGTSASGNGGGINITGGNGTGGASTGGAIILQGGQDVATTRQPVILQGSGGNVGIGTSTPASDIAWANPALDISGTRGTAIIRTTTTGGISTVRFAGPTTGSDVHLNLYDSSGTFSILTNGGATQGFSQASDGKVGIGTATPSSKLHVFGSGDTRMTVSNGTVGMNMFVVDGFSSGFVGTVSNHSLILRTNDTDRAIVDTSGNVGIGTLSPSYTLHVNGSVAGTSAYNNLSDIRLKTEVNFLENSLDKILNLDGVSYKWRQKEFPDKNFSKRREIGVIAQQVEKVFPEAIFTDKDGFKSVAYSMLIAPILNAIKELKNRIDVLSNEKINRSELDELKKMIVENQEELLTLKQENQRLKGEVLELKSKQRED